MSAAASAPSFALAFFALLACSYLAACLQLVHAAASTLLVARGSRMRHGIVAAAVALHACLVADAVVTSRPWPLGLAQAPFVSAALSPLWLNALLACVLVVAAVGGRRPSRILQAALVACWLPPAVQALGPWADALAMVDVAFFLATGGWSLWRDYAMRRQGPTALSVAEALKTMPVGMLVTDGRGGSTFMNDAMRSQLETSGYPTDLGDLRGVWEVAAAQAITARDLGIADEALQAFGRAPEASQRMLVRAGDGTVLLAMRDHATQTGRGTRVFTVDVTELVRASQDLARANAELDRTSRDLERQVAEIGRAASMAAYLDMRAAVHDVIGQRVSILQRYIDAGKADARSIGELDRLVGSVIADLGSGARVPVVEELRSVVEAFSLVDVEVEVAGELPGDERAARAFVRIIREASTNACRHGRARVVRAELGCAADRSGVRWGTLRVTDDGSGCPGPLRGGGGLAGMRRSVGELGGSLAVDPGQPFRVSARIPLSGNAQAQVREGMGDADD